MTMGVDPALFFVDCILLLGEQDFYPSSSTENKVFFTKKILLTEA